MSSARRQQILVDLSTGDWRILHIWLHAVCEANVVAIVNSSKATTEPDRESLEQHWSDAVGDGPSALLVAIAQIRGLEAHWGHLAALLIAIDALHAARPSRLSWAPMTVPAALRTDMPHGAWHLLPPPARQPTDLAREGGDIALLLHSRLGLRCPVVRPRPECAVRPVFQAMPTAVGHLLRSVATGTDLVVAMGSPAAMVTLEARGDPSRRDRRGRIPYFFAELGDDALEAADMEMERILDAADRAGAHVLLLPELELSPRLLDRLRARLRVRNGTLALVVAGSSHTPVGAHRRNRSTVLTGWGEVLWFHDKCVDFVITAVEAVQMGADMRGALGIDERGGCEDISLGEELVVCDLPFGRLSVVICLDYCGGHLDPLFEAAGVNLLLVPAMTPRTEAFKDRAHALGVRAGACTWIANSGWLIRTTGTACASGMMYRPKRGGWSSTSTPPDPVLVCMNGEVNSGPR